MSTITQLPTGSNGGDQPMGPTVRRTRAGSEELVTQKRSLSNAQRNVLLYANGKRSMEMISQMVPAVAEHPDIIIDMKNDGLIELIDPELGEVIDPAASTTGAEAAPSGGGQSAGAASGGSTDNAGPDPRLAEAKKELGAEINRLLGDEGKQALDRLEQVDSAKEFSELLGKILDLIKLYSGTPARERVAKRFQGWF